MEFSQGGPAFLNYLPLFSIQVPLARDLLKVNVYPPVGFTNKGSEISKGV